jgi:hypothetical protein
MYYLLEDDRHIEVVHHLLESYENTDHQYSFSGFIEPEIIVSKSFSEETWVWIHSLRNMDMVVGKHKIINFEKVCEHETAQS